MSAERVFALLGRRDEPTDAVEEYCRHLGQALAAHDFAVEIRRVPWDQHGWAASLEALQLQAGSWRDTWVLVQYTALAWSERGFPRRLLHVLRLLRKAGARIGVVFHDAQPFPGTRLIDRLRRASQIRVMRSAVALADHAVFTVPQDRLSWLSVEPENSSFIPVGANLPQPLLPQDHKRLHETPNVAVFSITGGAAGDRETQDIIAAMHLASENLGKLRLLVFGRHAEIREAALREGLRDVPVEVSVEGVIDGGQLVDRFAASDVLLFVRGAISSRRGSAICGICSGLPVIAIAGPETAPPVTEAGVVLLPANLDSSALRQELGKTLVRVLSDCEFRSALIQRSRQAHDEFFSWPAIASRFASVLG